MTKNTFTLKSLKSKCLTGKLSVPADKSISIRALLISSICFGNTRISNLLESEDVKNTLNCLKKIGVKILKRGDKFEVFGQGGFFEDPQKNHPVQIPQTYHLSLKFLPQFFLNNLKYS